MGGRGSGRTRRRRWAVALELEPLGSRRGAGTTWVLNKMKTPAEWVKVAVFRVNDELWTLPNFRDSPLPRSAPLCPMVSAKDVGLCHFILEEDKHYRCQDWIITFNMHKKLLHSYECRQWRRTD